MKMFLLGLVIGYIIASIVWFLDNEYNCTIGSYLVKPSLCLFFIIGFVPCTIWYFIRHIFKPVSREAFNRFLTNCDNKRPGPVWYPISENFGLFYNGKTSSLWTRYFLSRIK